MTPGDSPAKLPPVNNGAPVLWGLILLYGAGSMASQVLILREFLVLALGQELKLALGLWCWLLWTGLGSLLGGGLAARYPPDARQLGGLLFLLAWLLPGTVLITQALPALAPLPGGQSLPLVAALLLFLILLAPFGLVSGLFFPWACRVLAASSPQGAVGRVYYLEALGAALGVCLLQLLLLGRYLTLALSLGCGLVLALGARLLAGPRARATRLASALGLLLLAAAFFFHPQLEKLSVGWQWPGREILAQVDSPYARLTATQEGEQISFFANNLWQFTHPDPLTAEHQTQFGLLEHPRPRQVLLLGGGSPGLAPQILKTATISRVDYVELDPQLVALGQQVLAAPLGDKVRLIHQDARRFLAATQQRYDVILMALPGPQNAQLNRYYTREFFALVARRLEPGGVFSFSLPASTTSLYPLRAAYLALAYHTLRQVFPEVLVFPGERARFFASLTPGTLVTDPEILASRIAARRLKLDYVRDYYLLQDLSRPRQEYLRRVLESQAPEVNTDFNPRCYFYDLALSGIQEGLPLPEFLVFLKGRSLLGLGAVFILATLLLAILLRRRPGPLFLYQVMIMGLGTMALEIVILILFQIQLGSLYRQLGLLIAAFMAGLALGGAWGIRLTKTWVATGEAASAGRSGLRLLAALQGALSGLAMLLALSLPYFSHFPWAGGEGTLQAGYAVLLALVGGLGGAVFAGSAGLWVRTRPEAGRKGGILYAADLLGATLGSLGISLVVLPVWGVAPSLYLVAALHAGAGLMLVCAKI
ncbi:MAG: fused MFS/spermidine synthase [Deltaproteobacteria bacterium]|nr:fused MFS/spermidine synthase [Deltaproteobacteria bacterium]